MTLLDDFKRLPTATKWGIGGVGTGLAYFLFIRKRNSNNNSSGGPTGLGTGIDPSTGVPYSQEEAAFFNQPSQGLGGLGFGSSFDPSQFFGPSGTPTGTSTTPAAPPATPSGAGSGSAIDPATLESILDQQVGILSKLTGHNSSPQQVQAYATSGSKQGLTGTALNFFEQTQNVGTISAGLHWPQITEVNALAYQLAGGQDKFAGLPSLQQNQYKELANVQLLEELNGKAA